MEKHTSSKGINWFILITFALSYGLAGLFILIFIRMKTHSVIGASILHGTLNASAGIPLMYISGGNDLTSGMTGFAGIVAILLVCAIMVVYDRFLAHEPITNKTLLEAAKISSQLHETNEKTVN
jgi:hypothetical protein